MRIKKFIAANIKEGKALVFKELGDDAVILSSRNSKNPATGEDYIEIVAAIDESPNASKPSAIIPSRREAAHIEHIHEPIVQADSKIFDEIFELKNMLSSIQSHIKYKHSGSLSPNFAKIYKVLIENEIPEQLALEIVGKVASININAEYSTALGYAKDILSDKIVVAQPINELAKQKVVMFVGNTGSGKTSTLVKIAVVCKLLLNANILIVSADTYKVGGAEQLQTIASITGISFKAVYSPQELASELESEKSRDLILIDTTGRSQNSSECVSEIKSYCDAAKPDLVYLVLNATTSAATAKQVIEKMSFASISSVILSKIDEAATLGGIMSALIELKMPISYITNGQKIPDDIEPVEKLALIDLMLAKQSIAD